MISSMSRALPRSTSTREPAVASHASTAAGEEPAEPARDGAQELVLEFRDLWFAYDRDRPVLRGVSLQVPPRGQVALIGLSGAGKSTIFALIERFYDPDRGQILFRGKDVQGLDRASCRARMSVVGVSCMWCVSNASRGPARSVVGVSCM
jgi:ABC-type multidrug transport system fused ATPase/permease subunit